MTDPTNKRTEQRDIMRKRSILFATKGVILRERNFFRRQIFAMCFKRQLIRVVFFHPIKEVKPCRGKGEAFFDKVKTKGRPKPANATGIDETGRIKRRLLLKVSRVRYCLTNGN